MEQSKDQIIFTKSTSKGLDKNGRETLGLILNEEQTKTFLAEVSKISSRVKLQIHVGEGDYGPSAFMFVKEVQEAPSRGGGSNGGGAASKAATTSKIAALKKG